MSFNDFRCFVIFFCCFVRLIDCALNETGISSKSQGRFVPPPPPFAPPLLYPVNAATGILVAIAVPVPTDNLNVFVSYNFEGNYNMPNLGPDSFPGPLNRLKLTDPYPGVNTADDRTPDDIIARNLNAEELETEATTIIPADDGSQEARQMMKRSVNDDKILFTRRGVYHVLESRLEANGIEGKKCMLLAICESAAIPFLEDNGVLGHVLHVILTPSSSMDENLPSEYAKAEKLGRAGKCQKYMKRCNFNVLNMISKIL